MTWCVSLCVYAVASWLPSVVRTEWIGPFGRTIWLIKERVAPMCYRSWAIVTADNGGRPPNSRHENLSVADSSFLFLFYYFFFFRSICSHNRYRHNLLSWMFRFVDNRLDVFARFHAGFESQEVFVHWTWNKYSAFWTGWHGNWTSFYFCIFLVSSIQLFNHLVVTNARLYTFFIFIFYFCWMWFVHYLMIKSLVGLAKFTKVHEERLLWWKSSWPFSFSLISMKANIFSLQKWKIYFPRVIWICQTSTFLFRNW